MHFISKSEQETRKIAGKIFNNFLKDKKVLLISGDFGVGKTIFVKGLAEVLDIPEHEVVSPSFTLVREYETPKGILIHCDLYRIASNADLQSLDLERYYNKENTLLVVEWAQHFKNWDFDKMVRLEIKTGESEERLISIDL